MTSPRTAASDLFALTVDSIQIHRIDTPMQPPDAPKAHFVLAGTQIIIPSSAVQYLSERLSHLSWTTAVVGKGSRAALGPCLAGMASYNQPLLKHLALAGEMVFLKRLNGRASHIHPRRRAGDRRQWSLLAAACTLQVQIGPCKQANLGMSQHRM
jgi:hypothetical protein